MNIQKWLSNNLSLIEIKLRKDGKSRFNRHPSNSNPRKDNACSFYIVTLYPYPLPPSVELI